MKIGTILAILKADGNISWVKDLFINSENGRGIVWVRTSEIV